MFCKRCGASLPSTGYLCTNCGFLMDSEQIKKQKENQKLVENKNQLTYISERYGKKNIFQKREEKEKKKIGILIGIGSILFLVIVVLFVYFF